MNQRMTESITEQDRAAMPARDRGELEALRSVSRTLNRIGLVSVAVALSCAVVGFVVSLSEGRDTSGSYRTACDCLVAAVMLVVVGQLTRIRTALKDRKGVEGGR